MKTIHDVTIPLMAIRWGALTLKAVADDIGDPQTEKLLRGFHRELQLYIRDIEAVVLGRYSKKSRRPSTR